MVKVGPDVVFVEIDFQGFEFGCEIDLFGVGWLPLKDGKGK